MTGSVRLGDRGRVPFALVGVLLVVTSALFAAGVGRRTAPPEPAVDLAMERTTADARATLRQAVAAASVAAASDPVVEPADTPYGDVLSESEPFRDALAVRIYLTASRRFDAVGRTHRGIQTDVTLPETPTLEALARAKERITVERAGPDGTQLRVHLSGVEQTARDRERVVGRRNGSLTVRVHSPVLAVHDRVTAFQERLEAGLAEPGFSQRLTARLYAVAWARGYTQYGGAPISNVVTNRHISLLTNGAVLDVQRAVFGESDPDGRRALGLAVAGTTVDDALAMGVGQFPPATALLREGVTAATTPAERTGVPRLASGDTGAPRPNETIDVDVGETATNAFAPYVVSDRPGGGKSFASAGRSWLASLALNRSAGLNETIESVFHASVRTVGADEHVSGGRPPPPASPPGEGWSLVDETSVTTTAGVDQAAGGPSVSIPNGYHRLLDYDRRVTLRHERVRRWRRNGTVNSTSRTATEVRRVTVTVVGRHARTPYAPDNPIAAVHETGGPLDGPNLSNVTDTVNETVVAERGGEDSLAAATARGRLNTNATTVAGEWPADLRGWVYPELVELRERVRNQTVEVRRGRVGTFESNPPAMLAAALRDRRAELLDAPATYDSVADKARVALRGRYLDRVVAILEFRASLRAEREHGLADALSNQGPGSLSALRRSLAARRIDGDRDDDGALQFTVDGAPPYLTLTGIEQSDVAAVPEGTTVHPLVARNVNVASIPYGDATDALLDGVGGALAGQSRTRLRTGALALRSADSAYAATGNASLGRNRSRLREQINASVADARLGLHGILSTHRVGNSTANRTTMLDRAFSRWDTPTARALAVSNRSIVSAVVAAADAHESTALSPMARDRLRLDLRDRLTRALDGRGLSVPAPAVTATTTQVKTLVGDRVESAVTKQVTRRFDQSITRMPAGIPLAPVPGSWYATMNVWWITVEGRYERFAVEAPRRTPTDADVSLSYVRDGENVTLDVDGDGTAELLGRADRVSFRADTGVVVVVPPGNTGVGDVDGNMDEQSAGWPLAGPASREPQGSETGNEAGNETAIPPAAEHASSPRAAAIPE